MLLRNQTEFYLTTSEVLDNPFEVVVEELIIQENPIIMKLVVEPVLNLLDTMCNFPDVAITS